MSDLAIYTAKAPLYPKLQVLGLNASEIAMVVFVFVLVALAGKLPAIGEAVGSYLYKRRSRGG